MLKFTTNNQKAWNHPLIMRAVISVCSIMFLFPKVSNAQEYFFIGGHEWEEPLTNGELQPLTHVEWNEYMNTWVLHGEGEPYPNNDFVTALDPDGGLYTWEGGGLPEWPESPGLVMYWHTTPPGDSFSSAWKLNFEPPPGLAPLAPVNLGSSQISVTVTAPQIDQFGSQINSVSFGVQDAAGLYRSWHWTTGPQPAPVPWTYRP